MKIDGRNYTAPGSYIPGGATDVLYIAVDTLANIILNFPAASFINWKARATDLDCDVSSNGVDWLPDSVDNVLGYTPEDVANKATDFSVLDDTKYPTINATKNEIVKSTISANISLFMYNTASDIATYKQLLPTPSAGSLQSVTLAGLTGTQIVASFATNIGYPNVSYIQKGWIRFHMHALKSAGNATIFCELYKRTSGGTETLLLTSSSSAALTTSPTDYTLEVYNNDIIPLNTTDRLIIKVKAVATSGSPDVTIQYEDAAYSRGDVAIAQKSIIREHMIISIGDETTPFTTGDGKYTFRIPYNFTLTGIKASVNSGTTTGVITVNVRRNGVDILSTPLTIDATETTSVTATTPAVISTTDFIDDDEIKVDIDDIGDGTAFGLKISFIGNQG